MGNYTSRSWAAWAEYRQRHLDQQVTDKFDFLGLPPEVQTMVAGMLCPNCAFADGEIASTQEAKEMQRGLGNLALCGSYLCEVANGHRFHSFVMTPDPLFGDRNPWPGYSRDFEIATAHRYHNITFVELLERLLNHGQLREGLRFLSLRDFALSFKSGINKRRLRLLIKGSREFGLPVPSFVPALLALPNRTRDDPPWSSEQTYWLEEELWLEGTVTGSRSMDFDIWLARLLVFKLTPHVERLMIDPVLAACIFEFNPPTVIQVLPSVSTLGIPAVASTSRVGPELVEISMEALLLSFPNLFAFQNDQRGLILNYTPDLPAGSVPLCPTLRRLVLASREPAHLQYITRMLREFPSLEYLYFHRKPASLNDWIDDEFSNANVFDSVHHSLKVLKYTSSLITHEPIPAGLEVRIDTFAEPRFFDVPHFNDFRVLERLEIDQALLGRMALPRSHADWSPGPQFPSLDWKLPESLCRLTIRFVYDWSTLSAQLAPLATAKYAGQFPLLKDIFIVITSHDIVSYTGEWPPEITLPLMYEPIVVSTGVLLRAAGIKLSVSIEEIGPRPADLDNRAGDLDTKVLIILSQKEFSREI